MQMVFAAAGRRIDPSDSHPARFPLSNVALVTERIRGFFQAHPATIIVTSAACGADLIVLGEAGRLGIRRRVILPFDRDRFRATSVSDRPGDWGPLYDRLMNEISLRNEVIISTGATDELAAYAAVNHLILEQAESLARESGECAAAVLIWEGRPRRTGDLTQAFGERARERGMKVLGISTLD